MSPTAPFLAPERDEALKRGRPKAAGGTIYYTIPGLVASTITVPASLVADTDYYSPMYVETPILVDQIACEVTTAAAAGKVLRIGLYRADSDLQPTAGPLIDSGSIVCDFTGVMTYAPASPVFLPRGRYLSVYNSNGAPVLRQFRGFLPGSMLVTGLGGNAFVALMSVGRTYAAFPTPGTAWTTTTGGSTAFGSLVVVRVSSP